MVEEYFGTRHVVGQKQQVAGGPRQVVGWFRNAKGGSSVFRLSRPSTSLLLSQMPPHGITMGGIEWPIEPMPLTHRNYEPVESMRPAALLASWQLFTASLLSLGARLDYLRRAFQVPKTNLCSASQASLPFPPVTDPTTA